MPMFIDGDPIDAEFCRDYHQAMKIVSRLKDLNDSILQVDPLAIDAAKLLYVSQREYAVVTPDDEAVNFIGTDDATTCHIIILHHTGSGAVCLSHLDGWKTKQCVDQLLQAINTAGKPEGRIEVCIGGGFIDTREESRKLSCELLEALALSQIAVHLKLACISEHNDTVRNGVHFPVIYGMGVNVKQFSIFRAKFPDKGPDEDLRSAGIFGSCKKLENVYNEGHELVIGPYGWNAWDDAEQWMMAPDHLILKYLSTSPEQEPAGYVEHVRGSLKAIVDHPQPLASIFANGPRRYRKNKDGQWILVSGNII